MSGLDLYVKRWNKGQQYPSIFLTTKDTIQETVEGRAGANDYIKPF
jgi:DNA-binding response OmpR family regulator